MFHGYLGLEIRSRWGGATILRICSSNLRSFEFFGVETVLVPDRTCGGNSEPHDFPKFLSDVSGQTGRRGETLSIGSHHEVKP